MNNNRFYEIIFLKGEFKMIEENRKLLEDVITKKLQNALDAEAGSDEEKKFFDQAMTAVDKQINLDKVDCTYQENYDKNETENRKLEAETNLNKEKFELEKSKAEREQVIQDRDEAFRDKDARNTIIIRGIEVACSCVISPIIGYGINRGLSKLIMRWEEGNTFTTTPGKTLRGMFQFKK